jgi:hypothetical protein
MARLQQKDTTRNKRIQLAIRGFRIFPPRLLY